MQAPRPSKSANTAGGRQGRVEEAVSVLRGRGEVTREPVLPCPPHFSRPAFWRRLTKVDFFACRACSDRTRASNDRAAPPRTLSSRRSLSRLTAASYFGCCLDFDLGLDHRPGFFLPTGKLLENVAYFAAASASSLAFCLAARSAAARVRAWRGTSAADARSPAVRPVVKPGGGALSADLPQLAEQREPGVCRFALDHVEQQRAFRSASGNDATCAATSPLVAAAPAGPSGLSSAATPSKSDGTRRKSASVSRRGGRRRKPGGSGGSGARPPPAPHSRTPATPRRVAEGRHRREPREGGASRRAAPRRCGPSPPPRPRTGIPAAGCSFFVCSERASPTAYAWAAARSIRSAGRRSISRRVPQLAKYRNASKYSHISLRGSPLKSPHS